MTRKISPDALFSVVEDAGQIAFYVGVAAALGIGFLWAASTAVVSKVWNRQYGPAKYSKSAQYDL